MIPGNNGIIMQTATVWMTSQATEFVGFQHLMFGLRDSLAADFKIFCAPGQPDLVVVSWGCHCLLLDFFGNGSVAHVHVGTWRLMGSYKWGYKSPKKGYNHRYPT